MEELPHWTARPSILELRDSWPRLPAAQKVAAFCGLEHGDSDDFFLSLSSADQAELIVELPDSHRRHWIRLLAPDDLTDVVQLAPKHRQRILEALDEPTRREVTGLLAHAEDEAGGLMNSRFARVRPEMCVDEAIRYLRKQAESKIETMRYLYVLDPEQRLLGVVSLRQLFVTDGDTLVRDVMRTQVVSASPELPQGELRQLFKTSVLTAIPIVDASRHMVGIVTIDDIVDVVEEKATEDIQRLGGSEELGAPYLKLALWRMVKKRASWLVILFLGEMFTATAMGYFEKEIERAVVLALFIPLIISSGGNSGSQASTLVVRAIAVGDVRLREWWRVFTREVLVGLALGVILGAIGMCRILLWPSRVKLYGEHFVLVGATVACSLVGIVLWGSLAGSMLPFVLKKVGFDPAVASAPFVATLVDVSGLIIYFSVASVILRGTLL